ncbi:MAG TPA: hypothetical protein VGM95_07415 [Lactobacillaceae bacterium]|jgi:hypothetical protein
MMDTRAKILTDRPQLFPDTMTQILVNNNGEDNNTTNNWQKILRQIVPDLNQLIEQPILLGDKQWFYDLQGLPKLAVVFNEHQKIIRVDIRVAWSAQVETAVLVDQYENVASVQHFINQMLTQEDFYTSDGKIYLQKFFEDNYLTKLIWQVNGETRLFDNEDDFIQESLQINTTVDDIVVNSLRNYDTALLQTPVAQRIFYLDKPVFQKNTLEAGVFVENRALFYSPLGQRDQIIVNSEVQKQQISAEFPYLKDLIEVVVPELTVQANVETVQPLQYLVKVNGQQLNNLEEVIDDFSAGIDDGINATLYIAPQDDQVKSVLLDKMGELQLDNLIQIVEEPLQIAQIARASINLVLQDGYILPNELLAATAAGLSVAILDAQDNLKEFAQRYQQVIRVSSWMTLLQED